MKCLCCGKEISDHAAPQERLTGWHNKCVRTFFSANALPELDLSDNILEQLVTETTGKGYTIPGVQKKLSLHLHLQDTPRLTIVDYPTGYILKPQTEEYAQLPEAEYLVMQMAEKTGIRVVPHALMKTGPADTLAYITKRIDRILPDKKHRSFEKYAMEDFCQLGGRLTMDKYRGSYERCAKIIVRYSSVPGIDLAELFLRLVFCFVTGNSDMHLKNFSLMESSPGSRQFVLSAAYDLLPVNIILPEDTEEMALTLNEKKRNLRKSDFLHYAKTCGIPEKAAQNLILKVMRMQDQYLEMCRESFLSSKLQEQFCCLIQERIQRLG